MQGPSEVILAAYIVEVEFFSGTERYGTERYSVTATHWYQAELEALARSAGSVYDDDRIPDRHRRANARPAE